MQKDEPAETAVVLRFSTVKVSGLSSASHGSHAEHLERLNRFTGIRDELGAAVATILDTKGPEIRVRAFAEPVELKAGDDFTLTTDDVVGDAQRVSVTYGNLPQELTPGQQILIDDGLVDLSVKEIKGADIVCTVINGGRLSSNKSINIPGVHIHLPALTERDISDIRFGVENDFDFIAASFIRQAADVEATRTPPARRSPTCPMPCSTARAASCSPARPRRGSIPSSRCRRWTSTPLPSWPPPTSVTRRG